VGESEAERERAEDKISNAREKINVYVCRKEMCNCGVMEVRVGERKQVGAFCTEKELNL
jgi:hypothetical protein